MEIAKLNQSQQDLVKRTVAKDATDDELSMFLAIAGKYGLDPFTKEIWFIKAYKGSPALMYTSRDGLLKVANGYLEFDGMRVAVVRKGDKYSMTDNGFDHQPNMEVEGEILFADAFVYRKDRKYPAYFRANFREYNGGTNIWKKYPTAMIVKVAEANALKRAFSLTGLLIPEEMDAQSTQTTEAVVIEQVPTAPAQLTAEAQSFLDLLEMYKMDYKLEETDNFRIEKAIELTQKKGYNQKASDKLLADLEARYANGQALPEPTAEEAPNSLLFPEIHTKQDQSVIPYPSNEK
jgi:phage recombination protein Bet